MLVKICGLTRPTDAAFAESAGADFLGAIMAGGPRHLEPDAVGAVLGRRRYGVRRVGVFGTQSIEEVAGIAERLDLDVVQLHGDPEAEGVAWLGSRVECAIWPVLRVEGTVVPPSAVELGHAAGWLVLDAKAVAQLGGTGVRLDWAGLQAGVAGLRRSVPSLKLVAAGGLTPDNVTEAVTLLAPDVVDVSSGVEASAGIKDRARVEAFVIAARTGSNRLRSA